MHLSGKDQCSGTTITKLDTYFIRLTSVFNSPYLMHTGSVQVVATEILLKQTIYYKYITLCLNQFCE